MVMQLTDKDGNQIRALLDVEFDAELNGGDRDFQISAPSSEYDKRMQSGCRVFVKNTEIGGVLGEISSNTATNTLIWAGYTWRGLLEKKIIIPPEGQDRYVASGELNTVLRNLIEPMFSGVFVVPEIDTGVTVYYEFERFCTLLSGITKMLNTVNHRLEITYNEGQPNGSGWVEVSAVPIVDYSEQIELSQDSRLNFRMTDKQNGVNHLVVGGKGEMQDRNILHLYVQEDGSIGTTQFFYGIDEIAAFYENTSTDTEDLESKAIEHFQGLMNKQEFEMDVESLGIDIAIGDIIGGRDYRTGMSMKKPLENIIVKISGGIVQKEYKLEGTQ